MIKKIRHIGIVTNDLERAIDKFEGLGLTCTERMERKEMGLKIAFFPVGDSLIEFLCYSQPMKSSDQLVRSQKGAINHICLEVDDLEATIREFEKKGAKVAPGFPKSGAHGRIAFLYPETTEGVLIELCQV